jgi:hypothetical protein
MLRGIATVLSLTLLATACADAEPDADVETDVPAAPGDARTTPAGGTPALPPEDASVPIIEATLTEWDITLGSDSVAAGAVTIHVRNAGTVTHRLEVEGGGQEWATDDIQPGGDVTMSLSLEPGQYEVYCPIEAGGQSHSARGMRTTLRVR